MKDVLSHQEHAHIVKCKSQAEEDEAQVPHHEAFLPRLKAPHRLDLPTRVPLFLGEADSSLEGVFKGLGWLVQRGESNPRSVEPKKRAIDSVWPVPRFISQLLNVFVFEEVYSLVERDQGDYISSPEVSVCENTPCLALSSLQKQHSS